jgi:hypothetical protein
MAKEPKIKVFRLSSASYCLPKRAILNPVTRWYCKNLPYPKQVDVSYQRFHGLRMPVRQIKWLLLQLFRVATVTMLVHSPILVRSAMLGTTVSGGALRSPMQLTHGTVSWTSLTAMSTEATTVRRLVFASAV